MAQERYRGLKRAAILADGDPEVDALLVTGTRAWFCAGGDMSGESEDPEGLAAHADLGRARHLLCTGVEVDGHRAEALGLVPEVVPEADFADRVGWALEQIRRTAPQARAAVKAELNRRPPAAVVSLFRRALLSPEMVRGDAGLSRTPPAAVAPQLAPRPAPGVGRGEPAPGLLAGPRELGRLGAPAVEGIERVAAGDEPASRRGGAVAEGPADAPAVHGAPGEEVRRKRGGRRAPSARAPRPPPALRAPRPRPARGSTPAGRSRPSRRSGAAGARAAARPWPRPGGPRPRAGPRAAGSRRSADRRRAAARGGCR